MNEQRTLKAKEIYCCKCKKYAGKATINISNFFICKWCLGYNQEREEIHPERDEFDYTHR